MHTPATIARHPIHPMLVSIPIGLWVFSLVCDLIGMGSSSPETWHLVAYWTIVGGIVGALFAAIPGLVDLLSLKNPAIRKTALTHMGINLTVVVLYVINAWMRYADAAPSNAPFWLSVIAVLALLVSGWLGGKMVFEAGVGVAAEAEPEVQQAARATELRRR